MSKFTLKRIDAVKGRIKIFKLLVDMNCEFDRFCKSLEDEKKDDIKRFRFIKQDYIKTTRK